MSQLWDETQALRRELAALPQQQLLLLAAQELGGGAARLSREQIVEGLLSLAWVEDGAAPGAHHQAPGKLVHPPRDQPAGSSKQQQQQGSSSSWQKQQGAAERPRQHHAVTQPPASSAAAGSQGQLAAHAAGHKAHAASTRAAAHAHHHHHGHHHGHHQDQQELHRGDADSFSFPQAAPASHNSAALASGRLGVGTVRGSSAGSSSSAWPASSLSSRGTTGDDGCRQHTVNRDQQAGVPPLALGGQHARTPPPAAGHASSSACGGGLTPRQQRQQEHQLMLESKMQQLECSLQQLQMSPRKAARISAAKAEQPQPSQQGVGSLHATRCVTPPRQQQVPPLAAAYLASRRGQPSSSDGGSSGSPAKARIAQRTSPAADPAHGSRVGLAAEAYRSRDSSGGGSRAPPMRERCSLTPPTRAGSSIIAEQARSVLRQQQQEREPSSTPPIASRARSSSGTPRVGVMPCQKAILKKAQAEAAAAAAAARSGDTPVARAARPATASGSARKAESPASSRRPSTARPAAAGGGSGLMGGAADSRPRAAGAGSSTSSSGRSASRPRSSSGRGAKPRTPRAASAAAGTMAERARSPSPCTPLMLTGKSVAGGYAGRLPIPPASPPRAAGVARALTSSDGGGAPTQRFLEQQQQQQAAHGQVLHTPLRVPAARARGPLMVDAPAGRAGSSNRAAAAALDAGVAATPQKAGRLAVLAGPASTPQRQTVRAFGAGAGGEEGGVGGQAAAAAVAATPSRALMTSARRIVSTRSRTAATAAASSAVQQPGALLLGVPPPAAAVPVTPLQRKARRTVPSGGGGSDELDKQLQAMVERCLHVKQPDAHTTILHGPEPAKRWLQQAIIAPLKRAGSSGSGSSTCMAAGFCSRALLLHGPPASGKTELVHALAAEIGASLLYVSADDGLLKTCQEQGHRLLRAIFKVARRAAPCVVAFDDADRTFPSSAAHCPDPAAAATASRMTVELQVQLQALADMQEQLEGTLQRQRQRGGSAGGGGGDGASSTPAPAASARPKWGFFGGKAKAQPTQAAGEADEPQQTQQQPACARLPGPVVVALVTSRPDALDAGVLAHLPAQLLLELPSAEGREELLMGWLMDREAAVGVNDVERLARLTEGCSCNDLLELCHAAALWARQERRPVRMADFEAALRTHEG